MAACGADPAPPSRAADVPIASASAPLPSVLPPSPVAFSSASVTPQPVDEPSLGPECGRRPLADCPLQAWMKQNAAPPMASADFPALAAAFDKIPALAPPDYTAWSGIARDGAAAARAGDMPETKTACRTCHDLYQKRYRAELRRRLLP